MRNNYLTFQQGRRPAQQRCLRAFCRIALLLCLFLSAGGLKAQSADDVVINEDYFKAIKYEWTDANGSRRISNLAEPATEYNQIVAFLREVYVNPNVPGFLKDKAWDGTLGDDNKYVEVPYEPCLGEGNPYGMTEDMVIERPYREGATAMIVELVDDYVYNNQDNCEEMLRKIKRITLLPHQRYVDIGVSKQNPGYLFNFVGTLNRFFIITKGNNRIALNSPTGHAPFYHMFEEFSPSNSDPKYNAFATMNGGEGFSVDHNCTSVMGQNHITVMSPDPASEGYTPEDNHDYAVNFMFFLPDYRFAGDSRRKEGVDYVGGWYTYYNADHKPYFFFNQIVATIPEAPKFVNDREARVRIDWESTYNEIVGYSANEDFYIFRVVNDVIQPEPITDYELIAPTDATKNDDGSLTSQSAMNSVYIYEPRERFGYDVYYIVMGRRYLTDFELTESNIVDTTIPGTVFPEGALNIVIDGSRSSVHDAVARVNRYTHTIDMFDTSLSDEVTLKRKHLRAASEEGVERGTTFRLMRYAGTPAPEEIADQAELVASIEITDVAEDNRWNQYLYSYRVTDADGNVITTGMDERFKTQYDMSDRHGDDEMPVIAPDANKHVLARITDSFAVATAEGTHPDSYHYYIDYDPAVLTDGSEINYNAESNMVDFVVPHNDLKVGYIPYSEKEVIDDNDYDIRVQPNLPGLQLSATTNPNVESYTIYRSESNTPKVAVARVRRMSTGRLVIDRATPDGTLGYFTSVYKSANPAIAMLSETINPGDEFDLVVKYNTGNTYGNRIATQYDLPYPVIEDVELQAAAEKANGDNSEYSVMINWYSEGLKHDEENAENGRDFTHRGYRVWGYHNGEDITGHYTMYNSVYYETEPIDAPRRSTAEEAEDDAEAHVSVSRNFTAHEATDSSPVDFDTAVRLYAELPASMCISESDGTGFLVAEKQAKRTLHSYINVPTSIDTITPDEADAAIEYYDLRGIRMANPPSGAIVIRRKGNEVTKLRIP